MQKDWLDKTKDLAQIISLIAVPILLALLGWIVQTATKDRELNRDYVQLAVSVLSDQKASGDMRTWAVAVLRENSPVPFGSAQAAALASGASSLPSTTVYSLRRAAPPLPSNLAEPCGEIPTLGDEASWDDLSLAYIALTTQYGVCAARHRATVDAWPR